MKSWVPVLLVAAGGGLGSVLRYGLSLALQRQSLSFPFGTLGANLLGCLAIGAITALAGEMAALPPQMRLFLGTGVCGGFTTLSTFTYEFSGFLNEADYLYAAGYLALTVCGGVLMFYLGALLVRLAFRLGGG